MPRFFIFPENVKGDEVTLVGSDVQHISKVLRLGVGDKLKTIDDKGFELTVIITGGDNKRIVGRVLERRRIYVEPKVKIALIQGIPKAEKMKFIVQKCTEIGVAEIVPVITERVVVRWDENKLKEREERWARIALEAAKQCGRLSILKVAKIINYPDSLKRIEKGSLNLIPWELEKGIGLKEVLREQRGVRIVNIFIGPEGGFTHREVREAKELGAIGVTLGPRILRTETAGIITSALVQYELGDLEDAEDSL